ncbi:MAG: hypothetical protein ACHRHE_16650 [Tepidisphaerales bacterium]
MRPEALRGELRRACVSRPSNPATTARTIAGEFAAARSELTDLRAQLAAAQYKLRLSVPLDPFISQRPESP